jgi:hypothetical protein
MWEGVEEDGRDVLTKYEEFNNDNADWRPTLSFP